MTMVMRGIILVSRNVVNVVGGKWLIPHILDDIGYNLSPIVSDPPDRQVANL